MNEENTGTELVVLNDITLANNNAGTPPIEQGKVEGYQRLYIKLLEGGTSETDIDKLRSQGLDLPEWEYRAKWYDGDDFALACRYARAIAVPKKVETATSRLDSWIALAEAGEASSQLATLAGHYMKHQHWLASKHNPDVYGDKLQTDNRHQIATLIIEQ